MKRRGFAPESKAKVVLAVLTGQKSTAEVCLEHNLKPKLVAGWKAQFLEKASTIFQGEEHKSAEQAKIAEL